MSQQDAESMDRGILHIPEVLSLVGVKVSVYEQKDPHTGLTADRSLHPLNKSLVS
jgi:hypothetical protein